MSRRFIDETNARLLPDGRPSFEVAVGWDPPIQSFYIEMTSTKRPDADPWRRGFMGELPTFDSLMAELEELAGEGVIRWPLDSVLLAVLQDDQTNNLATARQDWHEVEHRKQLAGY